MSKVLSDYAEYVTEKVECCSLSKETYVGMDNLLPNRGGVSSSEYVPDEGITTAYKKGDILLGNIRPYFKKIWLAENDGGCSPDVLCIRAKNGVSPLFIYAVMAQDAFFDYDVKGAKGSKMPRGDKDHIMAYPVHEIENEEEVGFLIDSIYRKIQNNNSICSDLEAMAKLLYDYWFVQFDFPDVNGKPYKSSGGKMVWNEELKREIPEGWEVVPLNRCITTIIDHRGRTPKKMGGDWCEHGKGVMAISAKIVKGNRLNNLDDANWVSDEMFEAWMPEKLKDGDILMTSEAPLGEFYYIKGYTKYCLSQRLFAIRADRITVQPSYLFLYLSVGIGYQFIIGKQSGSTVFGIRQDELRLVNVLVPSSIVQEKFCPIVDNMYEIIRDVEEENQQLASLRDFLLPMLMNGQVKVGKGD